MTAMSNYYLLHTHAGSVRLLLVDSDLRVMESASNVTTFGRVEGEATENLTVTVIPLTVAQYRADPSRYRNSCDSIISRSTNIDPAEGKCYDLYYCVYANKTQDLISARKFAFYIGFWGKL